MLKLALIGANGKMGSEIVKLLLSTYSHEYQLYYAIISHLNTTNPDLNKVAQVVSNKIQILDDKADVVIDFSTPQATIDVIEQCLITKTPLVIGTTGFSKSEEEIISSSAKIIPILYSPNMSLSVNLMFKLVAMAAKALPDFEVEIMDFHHKNKKDTPSGTALNLGKIIASNRQVDFNQHAILPNQPKKVPRDTQDICFSSIRASEVIGKHHIEFLSSSENLSITSEITNRSNFAKGALLAASFIKNKPPKLYNMQDVLEI